MKTFKSLAETPHILITSEDIETIFCNIPQLYSIHCDFISQLEPRVKCWTSATQIAELFKVLVRHINDTTQMSKKLINSLPKLFHNFILLSICQYYL